MTHPKLQVPKNVAHLHGPNDFNGPNYPNMEYLPVVSVLGIILMAWGIHFTFLYLDRTLRMVVTLMHEYGPVCLYFD